MGKHEYLRVNSGICCSFLFVSFGCDRFNEDCGAIHSENNIKWRYLIRTGISHVFGGLLLLKIVATGRIVEDGSI